MNRHVLSACEPQAVFRFFEDICAIPHPSGHEGAVADYVEEFARLAGCPTSGTRQTTCCCACLPAPGARVPNRFCCRDTWIWCPRRTPDPRTTF